MTDLLVDDLWCDYAFLQDRSRRLTVVNHAAWALEDQLDQFLDSLSKGVIPAEHEARDKWLTNLETNRAKKYRHRSALLRGRAAFMEIEARVSPSPVEAISVTEQLAIVQANTASQEWRILSNLAADDDYATVARAEGFTVPALKSKVYRCRARLRLLLAA